MVDKVVVYNIALQALLVDYQTTDPDNDKTKSVRTLNTFYNLALAKVLADLDLNKTATKVKLQLTNLKHPHFEYVYRYPANCAKFRRIVSPFAVDNQETRIEYATETVAAQDVVVTNEYEAYGEIQPTDVNLSSLNPSAAIALGYMMAHLAASLIAGKGAAQLRATIMQEYVVQKAEAMGDDMNENVDSTPDEFKSSFVQAKLGGRPWPSRI